MEKNDSATALSYGFPDADRDCSIPFFFSKLMNEVAIYWPPLSEWNISPGPGFLNSIAFFNALDGTDYGSAAIISPTVISIGETISILSPTWIRKPSLTIWQSHILLEAKSFFPVTVLPEHRLSTRPGDGAVLRVHWDKTQARSDPLKGCFFAQNYWRSASCRVPFYYSGKIHGEGV